MPIAKWAKRAIQWLTRKAKKIKANRLKAQAVAQIIAEGTKYQEQTEKFFERLAVIEAGPGALTRVWDRVKNAKGELVLTADEVKYLRAFKTVFNSTLKK
jgi:hypothetical protein